MNLTKQQVLEQKCLVHPKKPLHFLYNGDKTSQHRVCHQCAIDNQIEVSQMVDVSDILDLDFESVNVSKLFPIHQSKFIEKFKSILDLNQNQMNEMKQSLLQLVKNVNRTLKCTIKRQEEKLQLINEMIKSCDSVYLKQESIKKFQSVLLSSQQSKNQNQDLHLCIAQFSEKISEKHFKENFDNLVDLQSRFSINFTQVIEKDTLKLIESIQFWEEPNPPQEEKFNQIAPISTLPLLNNIIEQIQEIKCKASKFWKSNENISIKQIPNKILIKNISSQGSSCGQCYLSPNLQQDKNYIIKLLINNQRNVPQFYFGLSNSRHINDRHLKCSGTYSLGDAITGGERGPDIPKVSDNFYNCCYFPMHRERLQRQYYSEPDGGYCEVVKGSRVNSENQKRIGIKYLEFRINLSEKVFKVSSPPDYLNVVQLPKEYLSLEMKDLFVIDVNNSGDSVIIESILKVDYFDTKM